jgi:hypothetical protein
MSDVLARLVPPDALGRPRRRRPGKTFTARERPGLRHDTEGIEVRIYKVEEDRDQAKIIVFTDAEHSFVSLAEVKSTDWDALTQRGTLRANVARQAGRLRSYVRGTAKLIGEDERRILRLADVERSASMVFRRSPQPSVRREVEDAFGDYAVSVIWLDRPPPNADEFPTWEQILNGC